MSSFTSTNGHQKQLQYNYVPTEWICIAFVALFGVSTFVHIVQAIRFRLWWLFPTAIFCGLLETTGWSARLWMSRNPFLATPVIIQAVLLVGAPTPFVGANFILLGRIIRWLGPQYSRLTPMRYSIIFLSCDFISLLVQAIGGGMASSAAASRLRKQAQLGSDIALGGTVFQLVAIAVYCALAAEFFTRYTRDRPVRRSAPLPGKFHRGTMNKHLDRMLLAMVAMTMFIVIRTIYRVVEFAIGLNGKVVSTQWLFNVFDGAMIVSAMYTLNLFHPGIYLRGDDYFSPMNSEETFMDIRLKSTHYQPKAV